MTIPTHLVAGILIGKITGNYPLAISIAVLPDVDHFYSYIKHNAFSGLNKFWHTFVDRKDIFEDQRFILHNFFIFILLTLLVYLYNSSYGYIFGLAYLSHLILDAFDNSDYFPFYPNKSLNFKGPILFMSFYELIVLLILIISIILV